MSIVETAASIARAFPEGLKRFNERSEDVFGQPGEPIKPTPLNAKNFSGRTAAINLGISLFGSARARANQRAANATAAQKSRAAEADIAYKESQTTSNLKSELVNWPGDYDLEAGMIHPDALDAHMRGYASDNTLKGANARASATRDAATTRAGASGSGDGTDIRGNLMNSFGNLITQQEGATLQALEADEDEDYAELIKRAVGQKGNTERDAALTELGLIGGTKDYGNFRSAYRGEAEQHEAIQQAILSLRAQKRQQYTKQISELNAPLRQNLGRLMMGAQGIGQDSLATLAGRPANPEEAGIVDSAGVQPGTAGQALMRQIIEAAQQKQTR